MENLETKQPDALHTISLNSASLQPASLQTESAVPLQAPSKLDLSRLSPPDDLESARIETLTIDGICGVY